MKLINCHIVGFGKIHDFDYDFKDGLNIFCEENGYGKSTFASFIKVMLYGFEDENKRKDREREKYRPWDKASYGGNLTFEYEGNKYEVSRMFGKNENEDSFEVRKLPENTVCEDFDKNALGTKIFGIDKDSFFRTAYIASSDLSKKDENVTDSIRAKLGNLTDATDDINNYESACQRFAKKMNEYTPERKTGKIKSLRTQIAENTNKLRSFEETVKATEILEEQIKAEINKIANDKAKVRSLKEQESVVLKAESVMAKKKIYEGLKEEYEGSRKQTEDIQNRFDGNVPTLAEINSIGEKTSKMKHLIENMESNFYPRDEKWSLIESRFENGVCTEEEIKRYISLWNDIQKKKTEVEEKEKKLNQDAEEYIRTQKGIHEDNYQKGLENYKAVEKKRKIKLVIFAVIAILSFAGAAFLTGCGILGLRDKYFLFPEVVLFVVGLVFTILILALRLHKKGSFTMESEIDIPMEEALTHVDSSLFIRNTIEAGKGEILLITSQVRNFLEKYKYTFDEAKALDNLVSLLEDVKEYSVGKNKLDEYDRTKSEYDQNAAEVVAFFERCKIDPEGQTDQQLKEFQELSVKYLQFKEETERKKNILVQFESENDINELSEELPDNLPDIDDLRDEVSELEEEIEKESDMLAGFRNRLEERQEERDYLVNLNIQTEEDKETLAVYEKDYNLMELSLEYLGRAKNALAQKYTGPTMEGFKKYCSFFKEENVEDFKIDTNLSLTKTEEGMQRRINDLSLGLKDVTDFCLRMGLIDAMYEKEKPFIILDDPFVNYDSVNLLGATDALNKIADEYQILYFTCHESRMPV